MFPRLAPVVAVSVALIAVTACGASAGSSPVAPSAEPAPSTAPVVTPSPDAGNVDGRGAGPELSIEMVDEGTISATIGDRAARAWRLVVAGTGERAGDRWEILVETRDIGPVIVATEIRDGRVVDGMDLSGFADGTAVAGGCHGTLPVCLSSDGFHLPRGGDGAFSVRLSLPEPGTPLTITGGTATWPGEPFVLGPWTDTEPFPWSAAG